MDNSCRAGGLPLLLGPLSSQLQRRHMESGPGQNAAGQVVIMGPERWVLSAISHFPTKPSAPTRLSE